MMALVIAMVMVLATMVIPASAEPQTITVTVNANGGTFENGDATYTQNVTLSYCYDTVNGAAVTHTDTAINLGETVKTIGNYAFYDCDAYSTVITPFSLVNIGDYAFANADDNTRSLVNIEIKGTKLGAYMFYNQDALTYIRIP